MKKRYKIPFALLSIAFLTGCNLEATPGGTAIMTAINYEGDQRIVYTLDKEFITPAGKKINKGDYKPVFSTIQNRLGINLLEHQAAANSGTKKSVDYFRDNWMTKTHADMSMGTVYDINNYSVAGNNPTILDLKPYIDQTDYVKGPDPHDPRDPETIPPGEYVDVVNPAQPGPLPNIALFLHNNPGVMMSIVTAKHSQPDQGGIYYVPYFDGFNDLEKGIVIRADYVERLLDDNTTDFSTKTGVLGPEGSGATYNQHFEPCYVEDGYAPAYDVEVPELDGTTGEPTGDVITIHKNGNVKNIIEQQNDYINNKVGGKTACSKDLADQFKAYITARYTQASNGQLPFNKMSDLFLGYQACYDTDELIALMRLAKVSAETLGVDGKEIITMMPRQLTNMRSSDIYRWAGQIFGVRGLESRNGYLYINGKTDYPDPEEYGVYGKVHDARGDNAMLDVLYKLRSLYQEGLILQEFDTSTATGNPNGTFAKDTLIGGGNDYYAGFMIYDYPKDLADYNEEEASMGWTTPGNHPYDLRSIIGCVAEWDTNGDGVKDADDDHRYMAFTESWASIKTSALCLNAKLVNNPEKLAAVFKFIDFIYSDEGMFLYNFGPYEDDFKYITKKAGDYTDGKRGVYDPTAVESNPDEGIYGDYIEYQGERYPQLTEAAVAEHKAKDNYPRSYVGATIPFGFRKLTVVPYETMCSNARHGIDVINKAIELGTFKHTLIGAYNEEEKELYENPFFQISPSAFFLTKGQSSAISSLLDKNTLGSMFTDNSTDNFNIWDALIMGNQTRQGVTLDNYLDTINNSWQLPKLVSYYQDAFEIMSAPEEHNVKGLDYAK